MAQVNLHAAKTQLSRLVDRAANGEEIIIAKMADPLNDVFVSAASAWEASSRRACAS
jgi:antitoxin (DNA-binding transcriptional repressor) of toxin-antitoxin stability system